MGRFKELLEKLQWSHVLLILVVGAGLFYSMVDNTDIEQKENDITSTTGQIENLERKLREAKAFEKELEDKRRRYAELVKELQKIQGALPKQFILPELLQDFLNEVQKLELEIDEITPDAKEEQQELYNSIGFRLRLRGTFIQFFILMDRFAGMKRLVSVERFAFTLDNNRKEVIFGGPSGLFAASNLPGGMDPRPGITAEIRLVTYRYRSNTTANSGAAR